MRQKAIFFIFFILLSTLATAQESNEDGGILPTSKFWSADLIVEKITVLLTPSIEAKIQKELKNGNNFLMPTEHLHQKATFGS